MEIANGMSIDDSVAKASDSKMLIEEIRQMKLRGEVSTPEFVAKMKELEVMLGINQISPFGTNELSVFEDNLREMAQVDMERIARKIGLNPVHQRNELKRALLNEFRHYSKGTSRNIMPETSEAFVIDPNNPKHQKLLKALE